LRAGGVTARHTRCGAGPRATGPRTAHSGGRSHSSHRARSRMRFGLLGCHGTADITRLEELAQMVAKHPVRVESVDAVLDDMDDAPHLRVFACGHRGRFPPPRHRQGCRRVGVALRVPRDALRHRRAATTRMCGCLRCASARRLFASPRMLGRWAFFRGLRRAVTKAI